MSTPRILNAGTVLLLLMAAGFAAGTVAGALHGRYEFTSVAGVCLAFTVHVLWLRYKRDKAAIDSITCYLFGTMPLRLLGACELRWTQHHQAWLVAKLALWQERHVAWARANRLDVDAVMRAYDKAELTFTDRLFQVEGHGLVYGVTNGSRMTVAWLAGQTLDETALQHEVSHLLQARARHMTDEVLEHATMEELRSAA